MIFDSTCSHLWFVHVIIVPVIKLSFSKAESRILWRKLLMTSHAETQILVIIGLARGSIYKSTWILFSAKPFGPFGDTSGAGQSRVVRLESHTQSTRTLICACKLQNGPVVGVVLACRPVTRTVMCGMPFRPNAIWWPFYHLSPCAHLSVPLPPHTLDATR